MMTTQTYRRINLADGAKRFRWLSDRVGVVDRSGRYVIPPKYMQIDYIGWGVFVCHSHLRKRQYDDDSVIVNVGATRSTPLADLLNVDGKPIELAIPPGCVVVGVNFPDQEDVASATTLDENILFTVSGENGFGLIRGTGEVLLQPEYESIDYCEGGFSGVKTVNEVLTRSAASIAALNVRPMPLQGDKKWSELLFDIPTTLLVNQPSYSKFVPLPNGSFLAADLYNKPCPPPLILTERGDEIYRFPSDSTIVEVLPNCIITVSGGSGELDYSEHSLGRFSERDRNHKDGYCFSFTDFDGVVLKQIQGTPLSDSSYFKDDLLILRLPSNNGDGRFNYGILDVFGNWVIAPAHAGFDIVLPDRFIKTVYPEKFDSDECKANPAYLGAQFKLLVRDHDLLGLTRAQLEDLIGSPNQEEAFSAESNSVATTLLIYRLNSSRAICGRSNSYVEFALHENAVNGYRFMIGGGRSDEWIRESGNAVPKSQRSQKRFSVATLISILRQLLR